MKKQAFLFLAVALVFALASSLAAQSTLSWGGRTLIGMEYRNDSIVINDAKFGALPVPASLPASPSAGLPTQ